VGYIFGAKGHKGGAREMAAARLARTDEALAALAAQDTVVMAGFHRDWSGLVPHIRYDMIVSPRGEAHFRCQVRYSDLRTLEAHGVVRQARADGVPTLPPVPPTHTLPIFGKLFDGSAAATQRGVDIQSYLLQMLAAQGGVRATTLELLATLAIERAQY
jgi:hypothetical protein